MEALIWVDWVILSVIGVSTLVSLARGFVREALSLLIWVAAFLIARTFHPSMQLALGDTIETPSVRFIAAFAILFFGTLVAGGILNTLVGHLVKLTGLTATDRVLGMCFGLARGVVLIVVAIALLRMTPVVEDSWWSTSTLISVFGELEQWSRHTLGDDLEQWLGPSSETGSEAVLGALSVREALKGK